MVGNVECGVRADLKALGINEPKSALDHLAISLAAAIDSGEDERSTAALARELRLTLAAVRSSAAEPLRDRLDAMNSDREQRQG
jgi:hypothetical protein